MLDSQLCSHKPRHFYLDQEQNLEKNPYNSTRLDGMAGWSGHKISLPALVIHFKQILCHFLNVKIMRMVCIAKIHLLRNLKVRGLSQRYAISGTGEKLCGKTSQYSIHVDIWAQNTVEML